MTTNKEIAEKIYPCRLPIKVIGENHHDLKGIIIGAMTSLGESIDPGEMSMTYSKNKKYVSITFKIVARSRDHMDEMYSVLSARKEVKMVL